MITVTKKMIKPVIAFTSLVGIGGKDYPLKFGNYFGIESKLDSDYGIYIVNFWAENLREWKKRNPDVEEIEITIVKDKAGFVGFISDSRLKEWCNKKLCITGYGWPSVGICKKTCELLGFESKGRFCGCEKENEGPRLTQHFWGDREPKYTTRCSRCKREWADELNLINL